MAAKKESTSRAEGLALYDKLIATIPGLERKGDTMPYTSLNGHMFSLFDKTDTLTIRLPEKELEAFLKKYKTERPVQYGIVMKEYAVVPKALLAKTAELKKYFAMSYAYIASLKPKPTTKAKKK
jgi:hypothetical protein